MQSLGGMIDKILDGGLEGVIEQSSRLQVLGGNAAIYSDPFSMMYNAGADPEALAQQFQDMTKGMGNINRKTGETEFSWSENMMLREIAKNQGRDVADVMDEVRARNRRESVNLAMTPAQKQNFTQDQIDYIGNLAHYSQEKGGFVVNVYKGNGEFEEKGINDLNNIDLEALQPVEHEARMEEYVLGIRSAVERITGEEIQEKADFAVTTFNAMMANFEERAKNAHEEYAKNRQVYIDKAIEFWTQATAKTENMLTSAVGNVDAAQEASQRVAQAADSFANTLEQVTKRMTALLNGPNGLPSSVHMAGSVPVVSNDAYIAGNGRRFGGAASTVVPINDGFIANPADEGLIGKKGGWVDKLINGMYTMLSDMYRGGGSSININGSLRLESNGQSIDIIKALENDPMAQRYLAGVLLRQVTINNLGGKANNPINNGNRNAFV
jgi:hypothetical protein